jgi:hypothetical protein
VAQHTEHAALLAQAVVVAPAAIPRQVHALHPLLSPR